MLSLENVTNNQQISMLDDDQTSGLKLFCYNECTNKDTDLVKNCRGVVFHGDKLIFQSYPYTDEYVADQEEDTVREVLGDMNDWEFYRAFEGTLLRVFNFGGVWYLSTHRKLNAFKSRWSSKDSFGTLFKRALEHEKKVNPEFVLEDGNVLESFYKHLDVTKQYLFLLRNNVENRIVCNPPEEKETYIYHVGTVVNNVITRNDPLPLPITKPERLEFTDFEDLFEFMRYIPTITQGIICFSKKSNKQVKLVNSLYREMSDLRGNQASVKFRYLELRSEPELAERLKELYPYYVPFMEEYENVLDVIAKQIYDSYVRRYIKKEYIQRHGDEYAVMKACHDWHITDRRNNRISLEKVRSVLDNQRPTNLNHMIKRYIREQKEKNAVATAYPEPVRLRV